MMSKAESAYERMLVDITGGCLCGLLGFGITVGGVVLGIHVNPWYYTLIIVGLVVYYGGLWVIARPMNWRDR